MQVVHTPNGVFSNALSVSLFLGGPTPRDKNVPSWRPQALHVLKVLGYDDIVLVPEPETGPFPETEKQIRWEDYHLKMADIIVFWIPRDMATLPGLTTNIEWGRWESSGKVVLGYPDEATNMKYIAHYAKHYSIPTFSYLKETLAHAMELLEVKKALKKRSLTEC